MTRILPPSPSLEHLRNEAKALLKAHSSGDPGACGTLRQLHRFAGTGDKEILADGVGLQEVQYALSRDYGFKNWDELKTHVQRLTGEVDYEVQARPGAFFVEHTLRGEQGRNDWGQGITMALTHAGTECDYHTVMGDSGLAFIMQADAYGTPWGKPVKQLDIGWWPLDPWGAFMRLEFLGRAMGRQLELTVPDHERFRKDPHAEYMRQMHPKVVAALKAGTVPAVGADSCRLVTGYDDGEPPVLGICPLSAKAECRRLMETPYAVVVAGGERPKCARSEADSEALAHAVALSNDAPHAAVAGSPYQARLDGKTTGAKSFALWAGLLRDDDGWGASFYHSNVAGFLATNRRSAVAYLAAMAARHPNAATYLRKAAAIYESVVQMADAADTSSETLSRPDGREALARHVEAIAEAEGRAATEMAEALKRM